MESSREPDSREPNSDDRSRAPLLRTPQGNPPEDEQSPRSFLKDLKKRASSTFSALTDTFKGNTHQSSPKSTVSYTRIPEAEGSGRSPVSNVLRKKKRASILPLDLMRRPQTPGNDGDDDGSRIQRGDNNVTQQEEEEAPLLSRNYALENPEPPRIQVEIPTYKLDLAPFHAPSERKAVPASSHIEASSKDPHQGTSPELTMTTECKADSQAQSSEDPDAASGARSLSNEHSAEVSLPSHRHLIRLKVRVDDTMLQATGSTASNPPPSQVPSTPRSQSVECFTQDPEEINYVNSLESLLLGSSSDDSSDTKDPNITPIKAPKPRRDLQQGFASIEREAVPQDSSSMGEPDQRQPRNGSEIDRNTIGLEVHPALRHQDENYGSLSTIPQRYRRSQMEQGTSSAGPATSTAALADPATLAADLAEAQQSDISTAQEDTSQGAQASGWGSPSRIPVPSRQYSARSSIGRSGAQDNVALPETDKKVSAPLTPGASADNAKPLFFNRSPPSQPSPQRKSKSSSSCFR